MALRRIAKELRDIESNPCEGFSVAPKHDDLFRWKGFIFGPKGTPYNGGKFEIDINFPQDYPFKPLRIRFITKIYHCNINDKGGSCLDILYDNWSPALTLTKVILAFISLLKQPQLDDGLGGSAVLMTSIAKLYKSNLHLHHKEANEYAHKYANAPLQNIINYVAIPEINHITCKYNNMTQKIKCNVSIKHPKIYDSYSIHIISMFIVTNNEEYKQNICINKNKYEFEIDKEIEYGILYDA
eukprot:505747_1